MSLDSSSCKQFPEFVWLHDKLRRQFGATPSKFILFQQTEILNRHIKTNSSEKGASIKVTSSSTSNTSTSMKKYMKKSITCDTNGMHSFSMPVSPR